MKAALVGLVLLGGCLVLLLTSPTDGNFWWQDAPRHALNGAFLKDFVLAHPWHDPKAWAVNYYLQYPALSILFYPPLFYVFEAVVYGLLGVSHFSAQITVGLFTILLAFSAYRIARLSLSATAALGVGLLTIGAPAAALWGRQVMLDVPAYACILGSSFLLLRHIETKRAAHLYLSAAVLLAAIYIKFNSVFIIPVFFGVLWWEQGLRGLLERRTMAAMVLVLFGLLPMAYLTLKFGQANVASVVGRDTDLSRTNLEAWLFYGRQIPEALGYVPTVLAALFPMLALATRPKAGEARLVGLLAGWFLFGYLFVSAIGVREPRHALSLLFPLAMFAAFSLKRVLAERYAPAATLALGLGTFAYSVLYCPTPAIDGYGEVAAYVGQTAPEHAVILFSGYRDGNFIFDMRTEEDRRDISIIRADKLLLNVAVERLRGVQQKDYDEAAIGDLIKRVGTDLIVVQPGFWNDLTEMARFEAVLQTTSFEKVKSFEITGAIGHYDGNRIDIYRPLYPVDKTSSALQIEMPIIGGKFEGSTGH